MTLRDFEPIRYWWCSFDDKNGSSPKYHGAAVVKAWDHAEAIAVASALVYGERWMLTLYEFRALPANLSCIGKLYRGADGARELAALVEWPTKGASQ